MKTREERIVVCDGEKNVGSGNDNDASDIMGGKWFGPASMVGGVLPIQAKPFSRYKALCIYSIPQALRNPSWFTSPIRFALPWYGPDGFQLAED